MLADFVQTAKRAIAKSGNTASAVQHAIIAEFHPDVIDYAACVERLKALGFAYHPPGSLGKDSMDFFIRG